MRDLVRGNWLDIQRVDQLCSSLLFADEPGILGPGDFVKWTVSVLGPCVEQTDKGERSFGM